MIVTENKYDDSPKPGIIMQCSYQYIPNGCPGCIENRTNNLPCSTLIQNPVFLIYSLQTWKFIFVQMMWNVQPACMETYKLC